jgi:MFS family permease
VSATVGARTGWLPLAVLLVGAVLPPIDFFIVNVALPSIREDLHTSPAETQLVISAYAAGYAVFLITGGRLGDLFGRRRLYMLGMAGFALANLVCGLAQSPVQLLAGRIALGIGAALLQPQTLATMRALYTDERALAWAMSLYGTAVGLAAAIGQFAGGALIAWSPFCWGWRAVFLLKLPFCAATVVAAWCLLPETSGTQRVKLDIGGAALLSAAMACVVLPLSLGRDQEWPAWVFVALACAPLLALLFLRFEAWLTARGGMPLVDVRLFGIPTFRRGVLVGILFFFTTSFYFLFGIYQQMGRGLAPLWTGLTIVPYGIGLFLGPLATAHLVRLRPQLLAIGMAIQVTFYAAIGGLVFVGIGGWVLAGTLFFAGFGQGIAFPRLFNTALGDVPPYQGGLAAGILNSALQVGASISAAAIGSLFFSVLAGGAGERAYAHAFAIAQWTLTGALALAALIAIPPRRPEPRTTNAFGA